MDARVGGWWLFGGGSGWDELFEICEDAGLVTRE